MRHLRIAVIGGLSDEKFISKVQPLIDLDRVVKVYILRYTGNPFEGCEKVMSLSFTQNAAFPKWLYKLFLFVYLFLLCLFRRIDLLIGIYLVPHGLYASLLGRLFCIPAVQMLTGTDLKLVLKHRVFLFFLRSAAAVGVRGEDSQRRLEVAGVDSEKIFILHNMFDFDAYAPLKAKHEEHDLIFVGYLRALKRVDILLKMVAVLVKEFPKLRCLIVGDGPKRADLEALVSSLHIKNHVLFHGPSNDVEKLLQRAKMFVMTSASEGLPMAVVEAMSCGLPVVVPRINEISNLVTDDQDGFLVNEQKPRLYAEACRKLLGDKILRKRMGHRAAESIRNKYAKSFSLKAIQSVWEEVLKKLDELHWEEN